MDEQIFKHALAKRVLAVAVIGSVGDWAAYIDAVPGTNHDYEKYVVAREGEKLPYEIAILIFPQVAHDYKWRD